MLRKRYQKWIGFMVAIAVCSIFILSEVNARADITITNNQTGTYDGYDYELWKDSGTTSMTIKDDGLFSCSWSNINNALFRVGKKYNPLKPHEQMDDIFYDYNVTYNPNGNSYMCIYGWSKNPLIEFYIVDNWGSWRPVQGTKKGTFSIDGGTYDIYQSERVNQPSIEGTKTFYQYWSVRTQKRSSAGTVSVTEHFKKWESLGMDLGGIYETSLTIEGYQSSGSADVTLNNIRFVPKSGGGTTPTPPPTAPSGENATIYCNSMEMVGPYVNTITSPFVGVALYSNEDKVQSTLNFTNGTHNFALRGCSNNNIQASVALYVGGSFKGNFTFGSNISTSTINNVSHSTGNQLVELRCTGDVGTWDAYIDNLKIS
ncbi:MAG: glycoside hydrolase family 11 protein [Lachnoclostridium sp.]|nr:glycoside hydrolase family 11 protein [Lachnoclostridium sp.]